VIVSSVMTDHPSWLLAGDTAYRAVRSGRSTWVLTCVPTGTGACRAEAHPVCREGNAPVLDVVDPAGLTGPDDVVGVLRAAGTVGRWRNPDLWDALATSIVRQVIRAGQARKLYRAFCQAYGEAITTPHGPTWLFPTPEVVLALPDSNFTALGMAFKRRPLKAAAEAVLEVGAKWDELDPAVLRDEVQGVPRIGPWTAGATVADLTNDYALYPYADLAVRTWANRLSTGRTWPETEPDFARRWSRLAGKDLSAWTLLTLAWGVRHANTSGAVAI
jgi:DNA-3-methyladenine glycosylase II